MNDTIFREYDIRGKVGSELLIEHVYDLTCALAYFFRQQYPKIKKVVVGMDGRTHSESIKNELCRAFVDSGLDVIFVGVCPSPTLYFAQYILSVDASVMITASHNPKEYNGFKICLQKNSVWGDHLIVLRDLYKEKKHMVVTEKGTFTERPIISDYVTYLVDKFPQLKGMNLRVVIDCANGAAGTVLPELIMRMKWPHVQLLYPEVDGTYPNHIADPTVEKNMLDLKHIVMTTNVQLGIGLDGDCDRMTPMTKQGELILGDKLLALFAKPILEKFPQATVVFDIKSSSGLIELLEQWGAKPCMSATGHTNIKDQMKEHNALLAGEISCHFFFKDRYFGYDDGIYAMLRLFELLYNSRKTLDELILIFPKKYTSIEYRIPCAEDQKTVIVDYVANIFLQRDDVQTIMLDGIRINFVYGWATVRASNTQPVLSLRFEANSEVELRQIKEEIIVLLKNYFPEKQLRQQLECE